MEALFQLLNIYLISRIFLYEKYHSFLFIFNFYFEKFDAFTIVSCTLWFNQYIVSAHMISILECF
jgi:hypothetical protein